MGPPEKVSRMDPLKVISVFLLVIGLVFALRRVAPRLGLIDHPDQRKTHRRPTPLVGGLAMGIAVLLGLWTFGPDPALSLYPYTLGALLLLVVGALDDRKHQPVFVRLLAQGMAAGFMVGAGVQVTSLGGLPFTGELKLGAFSVPFTIVLVVGLINAFNMLDGMDGLLGLVALGILLLLGLAELVVGTATHFLGLGGVVMAALIAFLLFNLRSPWRRRAGIFMGDAGSMWLGYTVAWLGIGLSQGETAVASPGAVAWILALPVMDTLSLMIRRVRKGQSPFVADKDHFHYILERGGLTTNETVWAMAWISTTLGAVGLAASHAGVSNGWLLLILVALFVGYFKLMKHAWLVSKWLRVRLGRRLSGDLREKVREEYLTEAERRGARQQ